MCYKLVLRSYTTIIIVVSRQGKSAFSVIRSERKDMHEASIRVNYAYGWRGYHERARERERKTIRSIIIWQDSGDMICECNRPKKCILYHVIVPLGVSALYLTKLYTYTISIRLREYFVI